MKRTLLSWHLMTCGCKPDGRPEHIWVCPKHLLAEQLWEAVAQTDNTRIGSIMKRTTTLLCHND